MDKINTKEKNGAGEEIDLEKYQDLEGVTLRKLNFGLWYVEHRRHFYVGFLGLLGLISILSLTYAIYGFSHYLLRGMKEDDETVRYLAQENNLLKFSRPLEELRASAPAVLKSGDKYDFYVRLVNPNGRHWAEFEYYFLVGNLEIGRSRGFLMPGESKYVAALGQEAAGDSFDPRFKIAGVKWQRLDGDPEQFRRERLDLAIANQAFEPPKAGGEPKKIPLNHLKFTAKNQSAYNYWTVDFFIVLRGPAGVVGINRASIKEFRSGEKRAVDLIWPGAMPAVTEIEIEPSADIMDAKAYMRFEGNRESVK